MLSSSVTVVIGISQPVSSPQYRRSFTALAVIIALTLFLYKAELAAVDQFTLQLGTLVGQEWSAESVRLKLRWRDRESGFFTLSAARFTHAALPFPLLSPTIECSQGVVNDHMVNCEQGLLKLTNPLLDNAEFPLQFSWEKETQRFHLVLEQIKLTQGQLNLRVTGTAQAWKLNLIGRKLSLQRLPKPLAALHITPPQIAMAGQIDIDLNLAGGSELVSADWQLRFRQLEFSDHAGSFVGEGLSGNWRGDLRFLQNGYRGTARVLLERGAVLTPFLYIEPERSGVKLSLAYRLDKAVSKLVFDQLEYQEQDVITLTAAGRIDLAPTLRVVQLKVRSLPLEPGKVFSRYLQPVLAGEFFEALNLDGRIRFELEQDSVLKLKLEIDELNIRQGVDGENFQLAGVQGELFWSTGASVSRSRLRWREGTLLQRIKLGPAEATLILKGTEIGLEEPFSLPLLDGTLRAERFSITQTDAGPKVDFQGYLTPISMELISQTLGWPPLAGQLSGMVPGATYENGLLQLRGVTLVRIFDGDILLRNLRLGDLFGPLPLLQTDIELKSLDLETLTSRFSFGKITGRLEGRIKGLRLEQWRPVEFDAWFATPEKDPGPHRISQKAVDNISNLGGVGVSGALSRSFLRIFEEFGYDRLGVSCRLENGICHMGGIGSAKSGYYLVKGVGLPRIDIIGFNRKTDWGVLVEKLQQISEGGTPVVE
ncbi:MAG: hypothetical protein KDI27_01445 [Gammaproteobacteria bacterium]|nr:hypothetical protein [Gammaproteobacteria bacterium]